MASKNNTKHCFSIQDTYRIRKEEPFKSAKGQPTLFLVKDLFQERVTCQPSCFSTVMTAHFSPALPSTVRPSPPPTPHLDMFTKEGTPDLILLSRIKFICLHSSLLPPLAQLSLSPSSKELTLGGRING